MLLAALTSITLSFTMPNGNASPSCVTLPDYPLDDLATVEVHFMRRYTSIDEVIYTQDVPGMEGQPTTVGVIVDSEGVLWVETVDYAGNHSCYSNLVVVAYTTDVPTEGAPASKTEWYDVAGRRYRSKPTTPGIYVQVRGSVHKKVIIQP